MMHPDTEARVLTPSSVKHYLQQRGMAPLSDVIHRFDARPDAVIAILTFWQQRGLVRRISASPAASCGSGCSSCGTTPEATGACQTSVPVNDLFEWITPDAAPVGFDVLADFDASWQPDLPGSSPRKSNLPAPSKQGYLHPINTPSSRPE
ncbi:MAG: FeoC-like transcriptional regulator [Halothiobacillus sp.]